MKGLLLKRRGLFSPHLGGKSIKFDMPGDKSGFVKITVL